MYFPAISAWPRCTAPNPRRWLLYPWPLCQGDANHLAPAWQKRQAMSPCLAVFMGKVNENWCNGWNPLPKIFHDKAIREKPSYLRPDSTETHRPCLIPNHIHHDTEFGRQTVDFLQKLTGLGEITRPADLSVNLHLEGNILRVSSMKGEHVPMFGRILCVDQFLLKNSFYPHVGRISHGFYAVIPILYCLRHQPVDRIHNVPIVLMTKSFSF